jgi:ABC-type transporter Mla MlaB component
VRQVQVTVKEESTSVAESNGSCPKAGSFRYYLHDNSDSFRFQFIGEVTSAALVELDGCWRTARSSVGGRKIRLDLRDLTGADEAALAWLRTLITEQDAECMVTTAAFSQQLGSELGVVCQRVSASTEALTIVQRLRCWFQVNLLRRTSLRRETNRKADDTSLILIR